MPVETKVAASSGVAAIVTLVFGLAHVYHWFSPPPAYLTALIITVLSTAAGYLAPHTPKPVVVPPAATTHH